MVTQLSLVTQLLKEMHADGGGICAYWSNMILNGTTTFIDNSAGRNGGGIYLQLASTININGNTTFINNSVGSRKDHAQLHTFIANNTSIGSSVSTWRSP